MLSSCLSQARAAALAAAELDEGEGEEFPAPGAALAKAASAPGTAWPLQAAVQCWPLGLALAAAPGSAAGPWRALPLLRCLGGLREHPRAHPGCGIASVRALPQVPTSPSCCSLATGWDSISHWLALPSLTNFTYRAPSALGGDIAVFAVPARTMRTQKLCQVRC